MMQIETNYAILLRAAFCCFVLGYILYVTIFHAENKETKESTILKIVEPVVIIK